MKAQASIPTRVWVLLRVLWSGIGMVDGHGKLGGTVIQKSRTGSMARVKVVPVNPRSASQQAIRSVFAYFSSKFRSLGSSVVAAWNSAAANGFKATNVFGASVSKTGHTLYVGLNMNLQIAEQAELTNPPIAEGVDNPIAFDPSAALGTTTLKTNMTFQGATPNVPADTTIAVFATAPLSDGVSFVKSQLRLIAIQPAATVTTADNLWADYIAKFGSPPAAARICMQVTAINENTGEAGIPFKQFLTVAP